MPNAEPVGPVPPSAGTPDVPGEVALPGPARKRLAAVADGRARASLESVAGAAGLRLAGFDPLTEVMGCVVSHLGWFGCSCGMGAMPGEVYTTKTLVSGKHRKGYSPYGKAVQSAWDTALARLLEEATRAGADGVVGIAPTRRRIPGSAGNDEFVLLGTAVRARGAVRAPRPFATHLGGDRFAALVRAGWIPVGYSVTVAMGVRHGDWLSRPSSRRWSGNQEVFGFTELVHDTRSATRDQFGRAMTRLGAETAILKDMRMRTWEVQAGQDHSDHLCEVTIEGTGLVAYEHTGGGAGSAGPGSAGPGSAGPGSAGPGAPPALTVLPLTDRPRRVDSPGR